MQWHKFYTEYYQCILIILITLLLYSYDFTCLDVTNHISKSLSKTIDIDICCSKGIDSK